MSELYARVQGGVVLYQSLPIARADNLPDGWYTLEVWNRSRRGSRTVTLRKEAVRGKGWSLNAWYNWVVMLGGCVECTKHIVLKPADRFQALRDGYICGWKSALECAKDMLFIASCGGVGGGGKIEDALLKFLAIPQNERGALAAAVFDRVVRDETWLGGLFGASPASWIICRPPTKWDVDNWAGPLREYDGWAIQHGGQRVLMWQVPKRVGERERPEKVFMWCGRELLGQVLLRNGDIVPTRDEAIVLNQVLFDRIGSQSFMRLMASVMDFEEVGINASI